MRIAITTPTNWPYVRRGLERFVNELAAFLSGRGHEVDIISTKPGKATEVAEAGYRSIYHRQLWTPALARIGIWEFHTFPLTLLPALLSAKYDLVFCGAFLDAVTATIARRFTRTPCVFYVNAVHSPVKYFRSLSMGGRFFRAAVLRADEMIAISEYMQEQLGERFGRRGVLIPVPVDVHQFRLVQDRDASRPVILCTAALDDERKGGRLLMRGFNKVKTHHPSVILRLSAQISAAKRAELLSLVDPAYRPNVEFLGAGEVKDLPGLYGAASITVLCSRWESFGMVVLESLACGTPVVGTAEGALPQLVNQPDIGRLFDAGPADSIESTNLEGLVTAMLEALDLARNPETPERCRARAEQFDWEVQGPRLEEVLQRVCGIKSEKSPVEHCSI